MKVELYITIYNTLQYMSPSLNEEMCLISSVKICVSLLPIFLLSIIAITNLLLVIILIDIRN
jgi:hypothetical protein